MTNERKTDGPGGLDRREEPTPAITPATPESTAGRLAQLRAALVRAGELCGDVERMVREGVRDARTRALMDDLADHFEDVSDYASGTSKTLRRLANT